MSDTRFEMIEKLREKRTLWKSGMNEQELEACRLLAREGACTEGSVAFAAKELPPPREWEVRVTVEARLKVEAPTRDKATVEAKTAAIARFEDARIIDLETGRPKEKT